MSTTISAEYRGKTITYNERCDEWECEDFAHGRGSPTLTLAKARVDKIVDGPDDKPAPFNKVKVWMCGFGYGVSWGLITLTSKAEKGFWATNGKERKKLSEHECGYKLKENTPDNEAGIAKIQGMQKERDNLAVQIRKIEESLTPFKS